MNSEAELAYRAAAKAAGEGRAIFVAQCKGHRDPLAMRFTFPSSSGKEPHEFYVRPTRSGPVLACSCMGYRFHMSCRHTKDLEIIRASIFVEAVSIGFTPYQAVQLAIEGFDARRPFGVEIEAFNLRKDTLRASLISTGLQVSSNYTYDHRVGSMWRIQDDSSIRRTNSFELISPPLRGEDGLKQVKTSVGVLNALGAQVGNTCGLHVHHDASDMTARSVRSLLAFYSSHEKAFDAIMSSDRRENNNTYCLSIIDTPAFQHAIESAITIRDIEIAVHEDRFHKVNVMAFDRHSTMEFRHHHATLDAARILAWIRMTQAIISIAVSGKYTDYSLNKLPESVAIDSLKHIIFNNEKLADLSQLLGFN